jgi:hypothetical protein
LLFTISLPKLTKPVTDDIYHCKFDNPIKLTHATYPRWSRDLAYLLQAADALAITLGEEELPPPNPASRLIDYQKPAGLGVSCMYNSSSSLPDAKQSSRSGSGE